jgi:hypothetical protein
MKKTRIKLVDPEWHFPLAGMNVGDSFFVPTNNTEAMTYKVKNESKLCGMKITVRTRVEEEILGIRVWRIT